MSLLPYIPDLIVFFVFSGCLWSGCLLQAFPNEKFPNDTVTIAPEEFLNETAVDLIGPSPVHQAVVKGVNHVLQCSKKHDDIVGNIAWLEILPDSSARILFDGSEKESLLPKYDNFGISTDGLIRWDLHIDHITPDDEGTYECSLTTTSESHSVTRTVEVEMESFDIFLPDESTPDIILALDGDTWQFRCEAIGARPGLNLLWYQRKAPDPDYFQIHSGFSEVKTPNALDNATYDTTNVLYYTVHKEYHLGEIKCQTTGQLAIPSKSDIINLEVHWMPVVQLSYSKTNTLVECQSTANPPVLESQYVIIIFGNVFEGSTLVVKILEKTKITCQATNSVGTGSASITVSLASPSCPPSIGLLVTFLVVTLLSNHE